MEENEKVREYINSAENWLVAAKTSIEISPEPAAFNALHSVELAAKAALISKTGSEYKTHNIGGEFGKYFKELVGRDKCRELNRKMMKYSKLRYPSEHSTQKEAREILNFAEDFLQTIKERVINID